MTYPPLHLTALAACLAATPAASLAGAAGSVDMTAVSIQLIDLDPSDGIAPSVVFPAGAIPGVGGGNLPSVELLLYTPAADLSRQASATQPFGAVSASLALPGATASASYAGDLSSGASFHASASASGGPSQVVIARADDMMTFADGPGDFVLSAQTELVMTATATLQVSTTTAAGDGAPDFAFADAFLQVSGTVPDGRLDNDFLTLEADPFTGLPASAQQTVQLSVSFSNTGTASEEGYYFAYTSLNLESGTPPPAPPPPALPEPAGIGAMLAGLALLAAAARRRRANGAT